MVDTVVAALNAGGGAFTAADGTAYSADSGFSNGSVFSTTAAIDGTVDDALYQSERFGRRGLFYDIPVAPGDYQVTLRFAEIYHTEPGRRVFDAKIEGKLNPKLDDVDLVKLVGPLAAYDVTVPVTVGADGKLDIDITASVDNAKVNAIKVVRVDGTPNPPTDLDVTPKAFDEETPYRGALSATDPDSSAFTYSITADPTGGLFKVQGGELVLSQAVDFEKLPAGFVKGTGAAAGTATTKIGLQVKDEGGRAHKETVTLTVRDVDESVPATINFDVNTLLGETAANPTSLQFGPDGRLYVADLKGAVHAFKIAETAAGGYSVTAAETINLVKSIANHNDDGALNASVAGRQVTGLVVTGTAAQPVIYVSSSDPRWGGGADGGDTGLDTNSGVITRLTKTATGWAKLDIVRGLPRSEENHSTNGLAYDAATNTLLVAQGGHTNAGAPSQKFAYLNEYALSAAILSVDLGKIGNKTYDIPTVDDPTRAQDGVFGGNDGLNMAQLVAGGPVQVFSPGYRNIYDLTITEAGRIYTVDNGPNPTWGGWPTNEGGGNATNQYNPSEPGSTSVNNKDGLHLVTKGYYGGHPNPLRANPDGAGLYTDNDAGLAVWRKQGGTGKNDLPASWMPVPNSLAKPVEGDYQQPGVDDGALYAWGGGLSVNGLDEYTGAAFGGQLRGDLLAAALDSDTLFRIELNAAGTAVTKVSTLAANFANQPVDVIAQGDGGPFPGTVWVASLDGKISVFRPKAGGGTAGDADGDGYADADELANGTDPNNAASKPPDHDGDFTSDLKDADDDNDSLADVADHFARDAANGTNVLITADRGLLYPMFSTDPGTGMFGLGFTGLMSNGTTDYLKQYDKDNILAGGATGTLTVIRSTAGDAIKAVNSQDNAFQFGVELDPTLAAATVTARVLNPFKTQAPQDYQSSGLQIGPGHQDSYLKIVLSSIDGLGGIEVLYEEGGVVKSAVRYAASGVLTSDSVDLFLTVEPGSGVVRPSWQYTTSAGQTLSGAGDPVVVGGQVLSAIRGDYANKGVASGLAVGVINTHYGTTSPIEASYDSLAVYAEPGAPAPAALAGVQSSSGGGSLRLLAADGAAAAAPADAYEDVGFVFVADRTAAGSLDGVPGALMVKGPGGPRFDATDTILFQDLEFEDLSPALLKAVKGGAAKGRVEDVFEDADDKKADGKGKDKGKDKDKPGKEKDHDDDVFVFSKSKGEPTVGDPPSKPGKGFGSKDDDGGKGKGKNKGDDAEADHDDGPDSFVLSAPIDDDAWITMA